MKKKGIVQQVLDDPELYAILLQHRSHCIKLKNVDYGSLQLRQLFFLPPWELLEEFRKDYETMLEEMIYGAPIDFNTLLIELRQLNMELATLGQVKDIMKVIGRARKQISDVNLTDDVVQTTVVYEIASQLPDGPDNIAIRFVTEFINTKAGLIFHRIRVV